MPITESAQRRRKARLNIVLNMVKAMETVEFVKLIGLLSVNQGFRSDLSRQYIRELRGAGYFKLEDGNISLTEEYKKQLELRTKKVEEEIKEREDAIT